MLESVAFDATPDVVLHDLKQEFTALPPAQQTFRVVRNPTSIAYLGNWRLRVRDDECPICLEPMGSEVAGDQGHVELPGCLASFTQVLFSLSRLLVDYIHIVS